MREFVGWFVDIKDSLTLRHDVSRRAPLYRHVLSSTLSALFTVNHFNFTKCVHYLLYLMLCVENISFE